MSILPHFHNARYIAPAPGRVPTRLLSIHPSLIQLFCFESDVWYILSHIQSRHMMTLGIPDQSPYSAGPGPNINFAITIQCTSMPGHIRLRL